MKLLAPMRDEASAGAATAEYHRPVLLAEVVELLQPAPGRLFIDGTLGGGGHSEALLAAGARVIGIDQDPDAIAFASERLQRFGDRFTPLRSNFAEAGEALDALGATAGRWRPARSRRLLASARRAGARLLVCARRPARYAHGPALADPRGGPREYDERAATRAHLPQLRRRARGAPHRRAAGARSRGHAFRQHGAARQRGGGSRARAAARRIRPRASSRRCASR